MVFVSGPCFDDGTLGIGTFVAEGFAGRQLDLVVAQAVLGPGLVDDLVDLLPLAELAEVAVGHCACGAAAACRGGYTRRGGLTVRSAARVIAVEPSGTCAGSASADAAPLACFDACFCLPALRLVSHNASARTRDSQFRALCYDSRQLLTSEFKLLKPASPAKPPSSQTPSQLRAHSLSQRLQLTAS